MNLKSSPSTHQETTDPESEKLWKHGSIAIRKLFANIWEVLVVLVTMMMMVVVVMTMMIMVVMVVVSDGQ